MTWPLHIRRPRNMGIDNCSKSKGAFWKQRVSGCLAVYPVGCVFTKSLSSTYTHEVDCSRCRGNKSDGFWK